MNRITDIRTTASKSVAHRALILCALSPGESEVRSLGDCEDVAATCDCLIRSGLCRLERMGDTAYVSGGMCAKPESPLPARQSGATVRLLLPSLLRGMPVSFLLEGRLPQRPLDLYRPFCDEWQLEEQTLFARGMLRTGCYHLPAQASSQFASGLVMALARLPGDSVLRFTAPPESRGYIDMTLEAMHDRGVIAAFEDERTLRVLGGQTYQAGCVEVEGDWSHGAFLLVAGLLGGGARVHGLKPDSRQPDSAIIAFLHQMGAQTQWSNGALSVGSAKTTALSADLSGCPDLAPVLVALCALSWGHSELRGLSRLRDKESDRLSAIEDELTALGACVRVQGDTLQLDGQPLLRGGLLDARNDHRIAMMGALAALKCQFPVRILGADCVRKSVPCAIEDAALLGHARMWRDGGDVVLRAGEG